MANRTEIIKFRATPEERALIARAALRSEMTVARWLRGLAIFSASTSAEQAAFARRVIDGPPNVGAESDGDFKARILAFMRDGTLGAAPDQTLGSGRQLDVIGERYGLFRKP